MEYDIVEENERERRPSQAKYPNAKKVFALWKTHPRNWLLNSSQLRAAENLFEERGISGIENALKWYAKLKDEDYCPRITSPYDLDSKWIKLEDFIERI